MGLMGQMVLQVLTELAEHQGFLYHLHQVHGVLLFPLKVNILQAQQQRTQ